MHLDEKLLHQITVSGFPIDQTHEKNCRPCHRWHSGGNKCRTPSAKFDVCIKDTKILISSEWEDQANSR
jgi:hypothetical protein